MSKKRMITRLLSVATAVTVGLSFCACGATPEEPKENRREEAEQKDTEREKGCGKSFHFFRGRIQTGFF